MSVPALGLGVGWRPELALFIERRSDLGFVEVIAENVESPRDPPRPLLHLRERGVRVVPHGISLSLGGAEPVDRVRIARLAQLASALDAPLVSEHIAFVRADGREAGHLLPIARTGEQLRVLVENVRAAQALLPVPLALENVAALFEWPGAEMDEAEFLGELVERTGVLLLLDLANVHANARNLSADVDALLGRLPLDNVAYVHVAGGEEREGLYYDTHAHRTPPAVLALVERLHERRDVPGVMLERDDHFPDDAELGAELDAIARAVLAGRARRLARAG
jgi:uncharacterized protein (UPF0276 family)